MKKIAFFTIFILFSATCFSQKADLDSLLGAKIFNLTYTKMFNHKPVWFNGKKYSVIGLYCIFKDSKNDFHFKKINAIDEINKDYQLLCFSEIYLAPVATAPVIATNFDNAVVVEVSELIRSEKRKMKGGDRMVLIKRDDSKYYYETFEAPYYRVDNGVKSDKIYNYSILKNSIKNVVVSKKSMKVILTSGKAIKIDRTTFLWNNGVTL